MQSLEMPSTVTDKKFVWMPQTDKVIDSDDEWGRCGKWIMLSIDPSSDFVDKAWLALQPLLERGTLILLKASTPVMRTEGGVLLCFTRPGKEAARQAAKEIREAVDYRALLHYKANKMTDQKIARRYGHKDVTMYMHTYRGRLYVKDLLGRWTLDDEKYNRKQSLVSHLLDYSGSEVLPSESQETTSILGSSDGLEVSPNWYKYCSPHRENGDGLAEADRVWIVAQRLLHEGACTSLSWGKNAETIEIRLYVTASSDVRSWLTHCDRIFAEAQTRGIMYFTEGNEAKINLEEASDKNAVYYTKFERGRKVFYKEISDEIMICPKDKKAKDIHSYKYTSEGELYEKTSYAEKFVDRCSPLMSSENE